MGCYLREVRDVSKSTNLKEVIDVNAGFSSRTFPGHGGMFWRRVEVATCNYDTKLRFCWDIGMKKVRWPTKPTKPPEEVTQNLPNFLALTTGVGILANPRVGAQAKTGRRKSDLWIAWRSFIVLRGWRMFEPDSVNSKKVSNGFGSTTPAAMTTTANLPASLPTTTKNIGI